MKNKDKVVDIKKLLDVEYGSDLFYECLIEISKIYNKKSHDYIKENPFDIFTNTGSIVKCHTCGSEVGPQLVIQILRAIKLLRDINLSTRKDKCLNESRADSKLDEAIYSIIGYCMEEHIK